MAAGKNKRPVSESAFFSAEEKVQLPSGKFPRSVTKGRKKSGITLSLFDTNIERVACVEDASFGMIVILDLP